jgi:hypothetical protein
VRAGNAIGDEGAASLAPSLLRMTQLTSLDFGGTLRASAASSAVSGCLRPPANALMMLRAVGWGGCARGWSGWWGLRGAGRGAAVRADNEINSAGAASLAPSLALMTQLKSLILRGTLLASVEAQAVL